MLLFILKYQTIIFFAFIVSLIVHSRKITYTVIVASFFISLVVSFIFFPIRQLFPAIISSCLLIVHRGFLKLILKERINNHSTFYLSIASLTISYIANIMANILAVIIFQNIFSKIPILLLYLISSVFHSIILILLWNTPRIRNSFKHIVSSDYSRTFYLFFIIIFFLCTIGSSLIKPIDLAGTIMLVILCLGVLIFIFWSDNINKSYQKTVKEREFTTINKNLLEKDVYILKLEQQNSELAKIIHRDNKLIPAMISSVSDVLNSSDSNSTTENAQILSDQLKGLSKERQDMLTSYHNSNCELPDSFIPIINTTLNYFYKRAFERGIDFDVIYHANLSYFVKNFINEATLQELLADLIENAIYAINTNEQKNQQKKILLTIEVVDNYYQINLFDSGLPFDQEILLSLGTTKISSHIDTGGSGIGMLNAFNIMRKTKASLTITEFPSSENFTKCIQFSFNQQNQYRIKSFRAFVLSEQNINKKISIETL